MRRDVQEIFRATPHHKQVMMFSATLAKEIRATCKKFMANVSNTFFLLYMLSDERRLASRNFRGRRDKVNSPWTPTALCKA